MATVKEIIAMVDELRPNAFSQALKMKWLSDLDGRIAADVFLMDITEIRQLAYTGEAGLEKTPLVEYPHDEIYVLYLEAKIDAENGEYNRYQNTMQLYNAAYSDFVRWFANTYEPANGCCCYAKRSDIPTYYLTAYGLAVKQGYPGTLDEWLQSLHGDSCSVAVEENEKGIDVTFTNTSSDGTKSQYVALIKHGTTAYQYAKEAGFTGTEEDFAKHMASVDLPCVDARSADFDMDAIFASGRHCAIYQTNGNTLGTPYKYGKTNLVAAMILSYSNSETHGFQLALPNGGERMYTRKRISGVTGEWTAIPNTTDLAKKLDINQGTANAGKVMLIDGEGNLAPQEVGMVETFVYGKGTFAAIEKACAAGSWNVTCLKDGIPYLLSSCDETGATFRRVGDGCIEEVSVDAQDNWTSAQVNLQTESDILIVDYGTKAVGTYTKINQALQAGKAVFCRNGQKLYPLSMADTNMAIFNGTGSDYFEELAFVDYEWTTSQFLKTTVVSENSNHRSYPTAKAVYDYVQNAIAEAMGTN